MVFIENNGFDRNAYRQTLGKSTPFYTSGFSLAGVRVSV